jgi:hypothetical protein
MCSGPGNIALWEVSEERFPGEPPDWRSGGEWTVRFVERDLALDRDGGFRIVVRMGCKALQILIPG